MSIIHSKRLEYVQFLLVKDYQPTTPRNAKTLSINLVLVPVEASTHSLCSDKAGDYKTAQHSASQLPTPTVPGTR